jgi:NAD(P)H-dependent FMN reductase
MIYIILGSTREGRKGEKVAKWVHSVAASRSDLDIELVDLRDWSLPFVHNADTPASGKYNVETQKWADKIAQADGFLIVTPEYNHGYPAVLKNALDHLYAEWNGKPVAFVSYGGR